MHDILIAFAFIGMVLLPCLAGFRICQHLD